MRNVRKSEVPGKQLAAKGPPLGHSNFVKIALVSSLRDEFSVCAMWLGIVRHSRSQTLQIVSS